MSTPSLLSRPTTTASEILAAAGVEEDPTFYESFTEEVEKAALTVPQRIRAAWQANDADAFAATFVENGSLLLQNDQMTSSDEIRAYMADGFRGVYRGARVTGRPLQVDFLSDGVALVVTEGGIIFAGEDEVAPERRIRAVWVIVARDGGWRLLSHQSSPIAG